jgi:flagellin-specific chaperone FliS
MPGHQKGPMDFYSHPIDLNSLSEEEKVMLLGKPVVEALNTAVEALMDYESGDQETIAGKALRKISKIMKIIRKK